MQYFLQVLGGTDMWVNVISNPMFYFGRFSTSACYNVARLYNDIFAANHYDWIIIEM